MVVERNIFVGVDTHKDFHVGAVVDDLGRVLATANFLVSCHGFGLLLAWAKNFGVVVRAGVEGTGCYGATLKTFLCDAGIGVVEVNRPDRALRRQKGKSDAVDAIAAARFAVTCDDGCVPKSHDGYVESLRVLQVARNSAVKARTRTINQVKSLLVTAPIELSSKTGGLTNKKLVKYLAGLRPSDNSVLGATKLSLKTLAQRYCYLDDEITMLDKQLSTIIAAHGPKEFIGLHGVGINVAATLLVAVGDNPERMKSERSFAALCGVSPVDASSGRTIRRRLNRGGNRDANNALWTIAMVRFASDPRTQTYVAKRTAEGKTKKEILRCVKRYLAREVYNTLKIPTHQAFQAAA